MALALSFIFASSPDTVNHDSPVTDWRAWQNAQVQRLAGPGFKPRAIWGTVEGIHQAEVSYRDFFEKNHVAAECTKNLRAFSSALWLSGQPGHGMGLEITDERYYATVPYPDLLEVPAELREKRFLKLLDENTAQSLDQAVGTLDGVNAKIAEPERKWRYFIYRSQHLPTPDGTDAHGRFLIAVPGRGFDRYIQFGLRDDPRKPLPHSVSIVGVQKTQPDTGAPLRAPRAFLKDLWRVRGEGDIIIRSRLEQTGFLENCYECHKRPLLPVVPDPSTFDAARWGRVMREVNARMDSYTALEYAVLDRRGYGPGLGPLESPLRTDAFLLSCAGDRWKREDLGRLRRAMRCARCHDGANQPQLDYPLPLSDLPDGGTLSRRYVVNYRKMPLDMDLTDGEREALIRCLEAEYSRGFDGQPGLLAAWLEQRDCPGELR